MEATTMPSPSTSFSLRSSSPSPYMTSYSNNSRRRRRMSTRSVPALPSHQRRRRVGSTDSKWAKSDHRHSPSSLHLAVSASSNLEEDPHNKYSRIRPDPPDWICMIIRTRDRTTTIPPRCPWGKCGENGTATDIHATTNGWRKSGDGKDNRNNMWKNNDIDDDGGSSMRKALSSTVFMIRELRGHVLASQLGDVEGGGVVLARVREEINESFCWLFQRVFSRTPAMMVCLMLLLAEFVGESLFLLLFVGCNGGVRDTHSSDGCCFRGGGKGSWRMRSGGGRGCFDGGRKREDEEEPAVAAIVLELEEEARLWRGMREEVGRLRAETRHEALMDHETLLGLVSPVNVNMVVEPDCNYPEYIETNLMYRDAINVDPHNPMILSNYAQFLFRVLHDLDGAEYYFKRAAEIKPADAEALSQYAQFLWLGKEDLSMAEEIYLEAIDADPCNVTYHSNYAHFLWMTGAEDTCYPLDNNPSPQ